MAVVKSTYGKSPFDYERYAVLAVTSIYGVDILDDNTEICRQRLFEIWNKEYTANAKAQANDQCRETVKFILRKNILCGDALTMKQADGSPIIFAEWNLVTGNQIKRRDYALDELLNVDNETLARLLANQGAMDALMRIEGFRSLNTDIQTIINKSESVKKAKKEGKELSQKEKKELSDAEKEYKSKRKLIQEKLIKFATRVPVFMYLTDYREYSLKDVITQLEPELFKKVTGLDVKDFELLVSLNVLNEALMNDAVYKFKRYEDASLSYTGIDRHAGEGVGLYSTVVSREDYDMMAGQLLTSEVASAPREDDLPDRPYFSVPDDEDEGIPETPNEKAPSRQEPPKPIMQSRITHAASTYIPAYVSPAPIIPKNQESMPVNVSDIVLGTSVIHKAFGTGTVIGIQKSIIAISFNGVEKSFQFPGAFQQGFLRKA